MDAGRMAEGSEAGVEPRVEIWSALEVRREALLLRSREIAFVARSAVRPRWASHCTKWPLMKCGRWASRPMSSMAIHRRTFGGM